MKKILLMLVALVATVTISAKDGEEMEGWQKSFTLTTWQASIPQLLAMVPCMPAPPTARHFRLQASPLLTLKVCSLHVLLSMTRMAMRSGQSRSLASARSMQ